MLEGQDGAFVELSVIGALSTDLTPKLFDRMPPTMAPPVEIVELMDCPALGPEVYEVLARGVSPRSVEEAV